ncbi:hypothetical protein [uncultured Sulfitobacter sp.]|uniref:NYN domain-containing protein n=1 Tax=uncultured Sulfitobacter sp. TaxID=191468 RepID=UPI002607D6F7|nr:hypothetical protein [uncultured Sulfitobacter sp.]
MKIMLDGSNILFWRGEQAQLELPKEVARALVSRRFEPVLYFDHSIKQYAEQEYLDDLLHLVDVVVAPRGTPADKLLLERAQQGRVQIVSNDRFRDWRSHHPRLRGDWLVTGSIKKGGRVSFSKKLRPAPL